MRQENKIEENYLEEDHAKESDLQNEFKPITKLNPKLQTKNERIVFDTSKVLDLYNLVSYQNEVLHFLKSINFKRKYNLKSKIHIILFYISKIKGEIIFNSSYLMKLFEKERKKFLKAILRG